MCIKNINMNVAFVDVIPDEKKDFVVYFNPVKKFKISETNNIRELSLSSLAVLVSATQSKRIDTSTLNPDETIVFSQKYEIKIRLTEPITGSFKDLATFDIEPSKNVVSDGICKDSFQYVHIHMNATEELPPKQEKENFVIKLLIRRFIDEYTEDDRWIVQTIVPLQVTE